MKCDLHIHSDFSDGIFSPEQLVDMAQERGLECISITDHDNFGGTKRAQARARQLGIKYLVGGELSCVQNGTDVHMLAYNVNIDAPEFEENLQRIANLRNQRNVAMVAKLAEQGINIDLSSLSSQGYVGRPIIAREMVRLGYCKDVAEVFDKYLGAGKCCYAQAYARRSDTFYFEFRGYPRFGAPQAVASERTRFRRIFETACRRGAFGYRSKLFYTQYLRA